LETQGTSLVSCVKCVRSENQTLSLLTPGAKLQGYPSSLLVDSLDMFILQILINFVTVLKYFKQ